MPRPTYALLTIALLLALPRAVPAQGTLEKARALYEAAAYDEALAILAKLPDADDLEPSEYRILCLIALQRKDQAQLEVDTLLLANPKYRPDPARVSPGARQQIEALRVAGIRRRFDEAKASLDAGEDRAAIIRLTRVLDQIDGAGPAAGLDDVRLLATTYRGLAQARLKESGPGTPGTPPDRSQADTIAPVPIPATVPTASADLAAPAAGQYELAIDERGNVTNVSVKTSVNTKYDDRLSKALRRIRFQPATRSGVAVPYKWTLSVSAGEIPSLLAPTSR